jgi:hypothetical protein
MHVRAARTVRKLEERTLCAGEHACAVLGGNMHVRSSAPRSVGSRTVVVPVEVQVVLSLAKGDELKD